MNKNTVPDRADALRRAVHPASWLAALAAASLASCGGGSSSVADAVPAQAQGASAATSAAVRTTAPADVQAVPTFHMAPVQLDEPADVDIGGTNVSAHAGPLRFDVDASAQALGTLRLTPQALAETASTAASRAQVQSARPAADGISGAVYTPAQIRAAYGLPDLPAVGATLSAAAAATFGAGQTLYIIDAGGNPNALADLNRFSTKFGLPTCTGGALAATTKLPLKAPGAACTFDVAYTNSSAVLKATAPAYNAGWAPEIALDVQWAHAMAPLARIVLIEVATPSGSDLTGGVQLANKMGPGVVSMSFGTPEGDWVQQSDAVFGAAGMTYFASTGDGGTQVNWPAVSPGVVAVGGTSLAWDGSSTRYEAAWAGSGGGISAYEPAPSWQAGVSMPGSGPLSQRGISDVSFNADPYTGQYVALTAPGSSVTHWNAYGGTSIASPQWAGIAAVANALLVASSRPVLGDFHATLYQQIGATPGTYASAFGDVTAGADGNCATCAAAVGYDQPTGWGTPNGAGLLAALTGAPMPIAVAPVVPGGAFQTRVGAAFAQSLGITAPDGVATVYKLTGAPAGLTVDKTGTLKWTSPVKGSYAFTATATTNAGKAASGAYTLRVLGVPTLSGTTTFSAVSGNGSVFVAHLAASNPNASTLGFALAGGPDGLTVSSAGELDWAAPVKGVYKVAVTVSDGFGMSSTRACTLTVTAYNHAPVLESAVLSGVPGTRFVATLQGSDADGDKLTYSMTGAPSGLSLSASGVLSWAKPARGTYTLKVTVKDSHGLAGVVAVVTLVVAGA